jgi:peptidoglycan/LPS O-acetylase OafA/YrhL
MNPHALLAQPSRRDRLVYVDALRGLAALTVLFHHTTTLFPSVYAQLAANYPVGYRAAMSISDRNYEAVLLFFVLSGFSIRLSVGCAGLARAADINVYLYRRFKRILPLFVVALALTALLGALGRHLNEPAFSLRTLMGNLLFLQTAAVVRGGWFLPYGENGPLWSLSYEMFYYLLFPVMVIGLAALRITKRTVSFACATGLSLLGLALFNLAPCPPFSFLSLFVVWYCGVDLAEHHFGGVKDGIMTVVCLIALPIGVIVSSRWLPSVTIQSWAIGCAIYCGWRAGLSLSKSVQMTAVKTMNICRALAAGFAGLGRISYGVYLFHFPLLFSAAAFHGQTLPVLVGIVALALGLAWIGEWIVARPRYAFMKLNYIGSHGDAAINRIAKSNRNR